MVQAFEGHPENALQNQVPAPGLDRHRQEKAQEAIKADQELQATKAEKKRLEGLVAALSESDRERLRALAIKRMPQNMIKVKTSVKNRMESLVEDFVVGKLN